jgi:hypothetical protein
MSQMRSHPSFLKIYRGAQNADCKEVVTMQEVTISSLVRPDALAKLLIDKGLVTGAEFIRLCIRPRLLGGG